MANRLKRCALKSCAAYREPQELIRTPKGNFCKAADCAIKYSKEQAIKAKKKSERAAKAETRAKRSKFYDNDLPRQKALTQTVANKLCALLDAGRDCISCSRPLRGGLYQNASHFKSRGANSFLRYDLRNLHLACTHDNSFKSGNIEGYRKGLLERYGQPILDYLDNAPRLKEWTIAELKEIRTLYSAEIKRLKNGLGPSKNWREV